MGRPKHEAGVALPAVDLAQTGEPGKGGRLLAELRFLATQLTPGDLFPSDRVIAEKFGLARMTVRAQIDALVQQGLLERIPGRGTFVCSPGSIRSEVLSSFSEDMRKRGLHPESNILSLRILRATATDRSRLGLCPGDKVVSLHRVRLADDEPMAVERVTLPAARFAGLSRTDLARQSLYEVLAHKYNTVATNAEQTITVVHLGEPDARLLSVDRGAPALQVTRLTKDAMGRVIEHGVSLYRADRYQVHMHVGLRHPGKSG